MCAYACVPVNEYFVFIYIITLYMCKLFCVKMHELFKHSVLTSDVSFRLTKQIIHLFQIS